MYRTDNYTRVDGLQLDRPPVLGSVSVKSVVVLPSSSAAGVIQFDTAANVTSLSAVFFHFLVQIYRNSFCTR